MIPISARVAIATLACAVLGCTASESGEAPAADSALSGSETVDPGRTRLSGLTLIAFYPLGSPGEEPGEDLAAVLDDFSQHLYAAQDSLRALGFRVETQAVDSTRIVQDTLGVAFQLPKDSADVGYYFAVPGGPPMIVYGVRTSTEIVQRARDFASRKP